MRDFKGMKRQRGRNRGGGNPPAVGGKPQQNVNRAFDSNGPENVKIRGHAQHVFEKYQQLARDAFSSGDRVLAENYLQHADHYFRVLRTIQPNRAPSEILGRDVFASGLDIDFEDEGEGFEDMGEGGELMEISTESRIDGRPENGRYDANRSEGARQDNGRQDNGRQDNGRQDGRRDDRYETRSDRMEPRRESGETGRFEPRREGQDARENRTGGRRDLEQRETRFEGGREDGSREPRFDARREGQDRDSRADRREGQDARAETRREPREQQDFRSADAARSDSRPENPRSEGAREGQPPRRGRTDRRERELRDDRRYGVRSDEGQPATPDPLAVIEPQLAPLPFAPPKTVEAETSPVLRSEDGSVSEAPAFLQTASAVSVSEPVEGAEVRKPKTRRRRPKALEDGEPGEQPAAESVDVVEKV